MSTQGGAGNDPLEFMRNMWGNMGFALPGMVTPTLDVNELDKRITEMKAVEGWLKMNLSMLQMSIQGLEMQRTTLAAMNSLGQMASDSMTSDPAAAHANPFASQAGFNPAGLWPWNLMQPSPEGTTTTTEAVPKKPGEVK